MITVKHKRGRHAPNRGAVLYCYGKLLFAHRVKVTVLFGPESFYKVDEPTFFKVCGWKSKLADGALDKSVRESLLAYMPDGKGLKFYSYWREGKGSNPVNTTVSMVMMIVMIIIMPVTAAMLSKGQGGHD